MIAVISLLCALAIGCFSSSVWIDTGDPETSEIRAVVVSAWSTAYGEYVTFEQRDALAALKIYRVDQNEMYDLVGKTPLGQSFNTYILLRTDVDESIQHGVLVHEYLHALSRMCLKCTDATHAQTRTFSCDGSAEFLALDELQSAFVTPYKCGGGLK